MKKIRDQQRQKLYRWQWDNIADGGNLELKDCQKLVDRICRHYKLSPPTVTDGRGRRIACYSQASHRIKLPKWARHTRTVIHETAHYIAASISPRAIAAHGREFVGVYMYLLNKYQGVEFGHMTKTANAVNLDFTSPHNCKPERKR